MIPRGAKYLPGGCIARGRANVLPLSRVRPYRTRLRDATRRAVRAAEAAGQRTAARRLLRRVGRPFTAVVDRFVVVAGPARQLQQRPYRRFRRADTRTRWFLARKAFSDRSSSVVLHEDDWQLYCRPQDEGDALRR